jgi:hypothetical protein
MLHVAGPRTFQLWPPNLILSYRDLRIVQETEQAGLNKTIQRMDSINFAGLTFRPWASLTILRRLTFLSPRSTPPT